MNKPIHVFIEKPVPVYKKVEKFYDVVVEKPIEKKVYRDVIVETIKPVVKTKIVEIPVDKIKTIEVENVIKNKYYVDVFQQDLQETVVEKKIENIVKVPKYSDEIIKVKEENLHLYHNVDGVLPTQINKIKKNVVKKVKIKKK